jgi:hypothetical protein
MLARRHLVVVLLHLKAHLGHHRDHLGAQVHAGIHRRHREIAALRRRPVAGIAVGVGLAGGIGSFFRVDLVEAGVHGDAKANVVEHEELKLRPVKRRVADPGRLQMRLGPAGAGPWVARVGLAGGGLVDVADQDQLRLRRERVHHRGRQIRHQGHVGIVDRLPSGNRRSVEHDPFGEQLFVHGGDVLRQVLPLAARVGEPEIDVGNVVFLDHFQYMLNVRHVVAFPLLPG